MFASPQTNIYSVPYTYSEHWYHILEFIGSVINTVHSLEGCCCII